MKIKNLTLLLQFLSSLSLVAQDITVETFKRGVPNEFTFLVGKNSTKILHLRGLVPGDLDCEIKAISPIDKISGEILIAQTTERIERDYFTLTSDNGRRYELYIPYFYFDHPLDFIQAFFALTNLSSEKDTKVRIYCTLKEQLLSLSYKSVDENQSKSISKKVFAKDPLKNLMEQELAKISEYGEKIKENLSERALIIDKVSNQFQSITQNYPAEEAHYKLLRDFIDKTYEIAFRGKTTSQIRNLRETVVKTKEYFLRIIPSARFFLKDILNEAVSLKLLREEKISRAESSLLDDLENEIARLQITLNSIPLKIEVSNELVEETLQMQLALRLHSIYQFLENERSPLPPDVGQHFHNLQEIIRRVYFHNLEIREHYILAMLNALEGTRLPANTKQLLQASVGLHHLIARDFMQQENLGAASNLVLEDKMATMQLEAQFYENYLRPISVELIPKHQWDRRKILSPLFAYEQTLKAKITPMPTPSWLGKGQFRIYSQEILPQAAAIRKNPANSHRAIELPTHDEEPRIERNKVEQQESKALLSQPIGQESSSSSDEEEIELDTEKKDWNAEFKKLHQSYVDKKKKNLNANVGCSKEMQDPLTKGKVKLSILSTLSTQQMRAFDDMLSGKSGVRWTRFESICKKLGIELRQPSKGSSHRTMHFDKHYLGTVWRPHTMKGGSRFGAGQTSLIQGYFKIWEGLL